MERKANIKKILSVSLVIVLALVVLFSGIRILDILLTRKLPDDPTATKTIERNGVKYFPRQDITVMLVMGIDERGPVKSSESYNNTGEADMVALVIFDETDKQIDVIHLNRDAMVDMPALGVGGKNAGTVHGQLALSHTYGDGLTESCENTKTTVSNLMYGLHIHYYVAMNMDAIPILNDAVGGVKVNVTEDFSDVNPSITQGQVTLQGQQALDFVQMRRNVGDQMNISRMDRQKEYMLNFLTAFRGKAAGSETFVLETYDQVSDYIVTDLVASSMTNIWNKYAGYEMGDILTIDGKNVLNNGYYEYIIDEAALDALILEMLYNPKNG